MILANILVALVAVLHLAFLVLEMFLWNHPVGRKTFKMTPEYAQESAALAANQGLYNGFLAAGLIWALSLVRHPSKSSSFFVSLWPEFLVASPQNARSYICKRCRACSH